MYSSVLHIALYAAMHSTKLHPARYAKMLYSTPHCFVSSTAQHPTLYTTLYAALYSTLYATQYCTASL